jgi:hypothetical protein
VFGWVVVFRKAVVGCGFLKSSCEELKSLFGYTQVKASRPVIHVLVINDNHCGLTFLLRYKNRLVR